MSRFSQPPPTIPDAPLEPAGDAAFSGMDMLTPPDQLPEGMVALALNAWIIGGEYRQRPSELLHPPLCPAVIPEAIVDETGEVTSVESRSRSYPPRWDPARIYLAGAVVSYSPDESTPLLYTRGEDSPGPQGLTDAPDVATSKWTAGEEAPTVYRAMCYPETAARWAVQPGARAARHAAAWTDAANREWQAICEDHATRLMAAGATQCLPYPVGVRAREGARLASGAGWLALSPADGSALLFWREGESAFYSSAHYEADDGETAVIPAGAVLLWHGTGRLLSAVGPDIHVGRVLSTRYDPSTMILRCVGGSGPIRAMVQFQGFVFVFKDLGMWQVDVSGTPDQWSVREITLTLGTDQPDSIAAWGGTLGFWCRGAYWTLDQVFGQGAGESRVSLAGQPLSEPIRPGLSRAATAGVRLPDDADAATWPKPLLPRVLAAVWQERLWLAVPVLSAAGEWGHEVWLYHTGRSRWEAVWRNGMPWQMVAWLILPEGLASLEWQGGVYLWAARSHPDLDGALLDVTSRGYQLGPGRRAKQRRVSVRVSGQGHKTVVETRTSPAGAWVQAASKEPSRTKHKRVGFRIWKTDNRNDDHGLPDREDYAVDLPALSADALLLGSGISPLAEQTYDMTAVVTGEGPFVQLRIRNTKLRTTTLREAAPSGFVTLSGIAWAAELGRRDARNL